VIRAATPADAAAITTIYADQVLHGTATAEEVPPPVAEMAARLAKVAVAGLPWLVMEANGAVAGYAFARPYHERAAYRFTVEDAVYVAADARGRGVGRALLTELIARCNTLGLAQMIASITVQAGDASIALHERLGFHKVGEMRAIIRKFGRWLDVVYLQRGLSITD